MTKVLHVLDASGDESRFQQLAALRNRTTDAPRTSNLATPRPPKGGAVCCIEPKVLPRVVPFFGRDVIAVPRRRLPFLHHAPGLGELSRRCGAEVIHAWGLDAATTSCAQLRGLPHLISPPGPTALPELSRRLRALPGRPAVVVDTQAFRARLMSVGIEADRIAVIRGAVDFAEINRARAAELRRAVVGDAWPVILLDGPASRVGGQFYGVWAAAVVSKVLPGLRVILPYASGESRRLMRFVRQVGMSSMLIVPDRALTWPQLAACADVFCAPAVDEVRTDGIAWAMAAGVPVVGSAVRSIAELIADHHNGLLCKPAQPRFLASKLLNAIEDQDLRRRVTDVARGQAYEVFSGRDFADNYAALYENLRLGRLPGDGLRDTAMAA